MPLILVNCDFDEKPLPRSFLYRSYTDSIIRAGGIPILMPVVRKREEIRRLLSLAQGVLLSGGDDPNPSRYGEPLHSKTLLMNPEKEETDFMLAEEALKTDLPLFGICWGMQLINIARGGSLVQDIPSEVGRDVVHRLPDRQPAYHGISVEENGRVAEMVARCAEKVRGGNMNQVGESHDAGKNGSVDRKVRPGRGIVPLFAGSGKGGAETRLAEPLRAEVNSFHHQAVKKLGGGLRRVAVALDRVIEAIEDDSGRFLVGVQWHPERMPDDPLAQELFRAFVAACGAC